jgi:hypothetical protein
MTREPQERQVRTYGGWRRARGLGLFGLGPLGTAAVLSCALLPLCAAAVSLTAGAITAVPALAVASLTLIRVNDATVASVVARRLGWSWVVASGQTGFRAVLQHGGGWSLPPTLASIELLGVEEGRFGLVWDLRTGHLTATLRCAAASTWLVDPSDADTWVMMWHAWLASLGYLPMVHAVAVTVDTAPEPGTTLEDAVMPRVEQDASHDVRRLMHELVRRSPTTSAGIETLVSITFNPATAAPRLRTVPDIVTEIDRRLTGLEASLTSCGLAVLGQATDAELAGIVRSAFDPAARGDVDRLVPAAAEDLDLIPPDWGDAGPVACEEHWDRFVHDSGTSVSWAWGEPPRQPVTSGVLSRLLSPGRFPRRVTLRYRALPAGQAARLLEHEVNAAAFRDAYRRAQRRDESARDVADRLRAQRAAAEEAQGAGVVHISLYATTTVTDPRDLPAAVADVESRADQSKIRLRRLYGAQAAGFVATLPLGRIP